MQTRFSPATSNAKSGFRRISLLVAGAGLEPASRGYEPREVPLLYPAIGLYYTFYAPLRNHYTRYLDFTEFFKDSLVALNSTVCNVVIELEC